MQTTWPLWLFLFLLTHFQSPVLAQSQFDLDQDGLNDDLEQKVLEYFRPFLWIDENECDELPAEFLPGASEPQASSRNGTLYGQVFPVAPPGKPGEFIEVHYYHLWTNDCGRFGHRLDSEYISGLLFTGSIEHSLADWKALYWFAAAHEGTPCDMSNAAPAETIGAVQQGPNVWVSRGKHASFLSQELCQRVGCGGDDCQQMAVMKPGKVINIGEVGRPLNGTEWAQSSRWSLVGKMGSDYDDSRLERFEGLQKVSVVHGIPPPTQSVLLAGNKVIGGLESTNVQTGDAMNKASSETGIAMATGLKAVGRSLQAVGRWLFRLSFASDTSD